MNGDVASVPLPDPDVAVPPANSARELACRLEDTVRLLSTWVDAMDEDDAAMAKLRNRLEQAAIQTELAVYELQETVPEAEFDEVRGDADSDPSAIESPPSERVEADDPADEEVFALHGRNDLVSLIEFIGFVSNLRKDGVLLIQTASEQIVLQIEHECIVFATSDHARHPSLGQILVTNRTVRPWDLDRAMAECRSDEYLGEALLRLELVDMAALQEALTQQINHLFRRMHTLGSGFNFQFREGTHVLDGPDMNIRLRLFHLLLNSARLTDEDIEDEKAADRR